MNISALHTQNKPVSAVSVFLSEGAQAISLQIQAGACLPSHLTKTPAMLLCITGECVFENEEGLQERLLPGEYVNIAPMVKHWVTGIVESQLLLIK